MKSLHPVGRQLGDFLTFVLFPLFCLFTPYRIGQAMLLLITRRGWLLGARSEHALQQARRFVTIDDETSWKQRWRLVEMMEARDMWLMSFGRARTISKRVRLENLPSAQQGLVLLGLHWSPTAVVLQIFREAGLGPRLVHRVIDNELRSVVPFQWIYSKVNIRFIRQVCAGRGIEVPGARRKLLAALAEPGSPVVVLDAPTTREGRSIPAKVLGLDVEFNPEGPELMAAGGAKCVHYWLELDADGERLLRCGDISQPQTAEQLVSEFTGFMSSVLASDSAKWRLWHVADQFFRVERESAAGQA
jgi:hypothetical protein